MLWIDGGGGDDNFNDIYYEKAVSTENMVTWSFKSFLYPDINWNHGVSLLA